MNSIISRRIGETFNPWRGACGFYPPNIVGRRKNISDGPKRVYERLVRFAGQNGHCYPSYQALADDLGKSLAQVKRDVATLERMGLITHKSRDRRRSNTYLFLWHVMFEGAQVGRQTETETQLESRAPNSQLEQGRSAEGAYMIPQTCSDLSRQTMDEPSRELIYGDLTVRPRATNSVQEFSAANSSAPQSVSKGRFPTNENLCEIAEGLARELGSVHPVPGALATSAIERILGAAVDPVNAINEIRKSHTAFRVYWREERYRNPRKFIPPLVRWFTDGDYINPPRATSENEPTDDYMEAEDYLRQQETTHV